MRPGLLVNPDGTRTRARVARDSWSTPWPLGSGNESSGTAGRRHGHSHQIASRPGELVDTAGPRIHADVLLECWSSPRDLGHVPELPRTSVDAAALGPRCELSWTAGQPQGISDPCLSRPGQLVDNEGPQNGALTTRESWSSMQNLGHGPELLGKPCRRCGPSYLGAIRPGQLVDRGGESDNARVTSESSLTPRALRTVPESPGQLVDTAGPRTRARITQGTWSTPRAFGHGPDRLGELVYPAGPSTRAQVA